MNQPQQMNVMMKRNWLPPLDNTKFNTVRVQHYEPMMGKVEINTEDGLLGRNSHPETEINLDEGAGNSAYERAQLLIRDPYDDNPFIMEDMNHMQQRNHKD